MWEKKQNYIIDGDDKVVLTQAKVNIFTVAVTDGDDFKGCSELYEERSLSSNLIDGEVLVFLTVM